MALYKQEKPAQLPSACHSGYITCERITISNPEFNSVELGYKNFHCVRRLCEKHALPSCAACVKDMTPFCFKIKKCYDSPELVKLLIEYYIYNAKIKRGCGVIWWDNKWYNDIVRAMKYPINKNECSPKVNKGCPVEKDEDYLII